MASPRERMLRLLSLLQTSRRWSAGDLAAAMEATPRTLRRDIEHLRKLGYPVRSMRGPGGHYQLAAGRALPPLMLEDDEAIAAVLGLRLAAAGGTGIDFTTDAAERALGKLRRILPAPLRRRTDEVLTAVEISGTGHPQPTPELLASAATAIVARRRLTFTYGGNGGATHREVEPARLLRIAQRWYLFAWDGDREDWRTFRLDRITGAPVTTSSFIPRPLPAEDLPGYLHESFRGAPLRRIVLTLHVNVQEAASRLYRIDGSLEPLAEGRCRYTVSADSYQWVAVVLMLTDIEFSVDEPDDFRDYLAVEARRMLRATATA